MRVARRQPAALDDHPAELQKAKGALVKNGPERTNAFYGFVDNKDISFKRKA